MVFGQFAHHIRDDMHHMAVALDDELLGRAHGANLGHTAHIVAPQIQQHQMFGQLFFIGQQILL